MSESSKMGLFGSKDDNTEATDTNKEPAKPDEASRDRYVPYNIDSDSETYDTEALSIMDINDIIGIQAESAVESTLESEFAALSEVITDIKNDDLFPQVERSVGTKKEVVSRTNKIPDVGSTEDKGQEKDFPKEDICERKNDDKHLDSPGMAGVNNSLQLIGEAYISEDSQGTDCEEKPSTNVSKLDSVTLGAGDNSIKTVEEDTSKMVPSATFVSEQVVEKQIERIDGLSEFETVGKADKPTESLIKLAEEEPKNIHAEQPVDSTDSPVTATSEKLTEDEHKTESMDVDSAIMQDNIENVVEEKRVCNKPEESKSVEEVVENSKVESAKVESVKPLTEPVESEEPMEVDQSIDVSTEKNADHVAGSDKENQCLSPIADGNATANSKTILQPEKSQTSVEELFDGSAKLIESEIRDESSNDHVPKKVTSDSATEENKNTVLVQETKESHNSSKEEVPEKFEMETDESRVKESMSEKIDSTSSIEKVVEPITEIAETPLNATNNDLPKTSQEASLNEESTSQTSRELEKLNKCDVPHEESAKSPGEPMEVDDNATYEKRISDKNDVNVPNSPSDCANAVEATETIVASVKENATDQLAETTLGTRENASEKIEAVDIAYSSDIPTKVSSNSESNSVFESPERPATVVDVVPEAISKERGEAKDESSTTEWTEKVPEIVVTAPSPPKEDTNERGLKQKESNVEPAMAVEAMEIEDATNKTKECEESKELKSEESTSEITQSISDVIVSKTSVSESDQVPLEEEKMEVDGKVKGEVQKEDNEKCGREREERQEKDDEKVCREVEENQEEEDGKIRQVEEASEELEEPAIKVNETNAPEEESAIEKPTDSEKIELDLDETNEENKVPINSVFVEKKGTEIVKSFDETDEAKVELKEESTVSLTLTEKESSATEVPSIGETLVNVSVEEADNRTEEDEAEQNVNQKVETLIEKDCRLETSESPLEPVEAEELKKPEEESVKMSISMEKEEALDEKVEEVIAEKVFGAMDEDVEAADSGIQLDTKVEEDSIPTEKLESPSKDVEPKAQDEEGDKISNEHNKDISTPTEKNDPPACSEIAIEEAQNSIKDSKIQKEEVEACPDESSKSEEASTERKPEIQSLESVDEDGVKNVKEKKEEREDNEENKGKGESEEKQDDSKSEEVVTEPQTCPEALTEISELPPADSSSKEQQEQDSSPAIESEAESHFVFPKPEAPQQEITRKDMSSSSINPEDVEGEEDPVEGEMNLSLDPEITEFREDDTEEQPQPADPSFMAIAVDTEEMEDQVDINLSLDPEENVDDLPSVQDEPVEKIAVADSVDESSMSSAMERQSDERLEKPRVDDEDDSCPKDILSTIIQQPQIFHDEQSQNTQEMMDSILETDSSNFNKILDDEEGAALACANALPLEEAEIDELADKLPSESEELLSKALDDPMSSQNIDSLEGLLDLDLMQEGDESTLKSVGPIVAKVMNEAEEDETKVDVSLLLEDQGESVDRDDFPSTAEANSTSVLPKIIPEDAKVIDVPVDSLLEKSALNQVIDSPLPQLVEAAETALTENDIDATFDLPIVETNVVEADQLVCEESKLELAEDLLREIAVDEETKMELAGKLLLEGDSGKESKIVLGEELLMESAVEKEDGLPTASIEPERALVLVDEVLLASPVPEDAKIELAEDISLERVVRDQVLTVAAEMEDLPPSSEISELESAVKFLQESEEQDIDSPLVLSPKMVDSVVDEIGRDEDVAMFVTDSDICEDPSVLVAELESIIPDPIAISEAEIISEAAKLENERKTKLSEEAKLLSPVPRTIEESNSEAVASPTFSTTQQTPTPIVPHPETPKTHREPRETMAKGLEVKLEEATLLKKSAPIPKISILEERLKEPPKIEIPSVGEVSRICEMPTTPKTSLLIQRDAKLSSFQKMLESPKSSSNDKSEMKIVDTPRKETPTDKYDFENVGSPRIILKIAKSAIADCGEPRSPKSPKLRSATNSPNPEDSPGQKLGKIKLKLSKGGHPSIISNENVEEVCGQWHTEGTSSLSPLGMKIKFSKIGDAASIIQTEKHEASEEPKETTKHKFEEAKRTESPIGMKIKLSKSGDASIVQQDSKDTKHKEKLEMMQDSPKRNESPIGMKIKFSKTGDASIIQPEKLDSTEDHREGGSKLKDKLDVPQEPPRRTESPLGMKIKLFKTGDASIVASEIGEESPQEVKRTDSPLGMKIKLSKTRGSASIVQPEAADEVKERQEIPESPRRTESPLGMKIKFSKSGDASIIHPEDSKDPAKHKERGDTGQESVQTSEAPVGLKIKVPKSREASTIQNETSEESENTAQKRTEASIGMKFKLSKSGDASIVHSEAQEHSEDPRAKEKPESLHEGGRKPDAVIGMKIKFSKTGDPSIIQPQLGKKSEEVASEEEHQRQPEGAMPMKIKLQKGGDASIVEPERKEKATRSRKELDSPLEMKIKLSKTGHPTIVACDNYGESSQRTKDTTESHKHKEAANESSMKMLKSMHPGMHGNRTELTIEPVQMQARKSEAGSEASPKRKDVTISPVESKKAKLEAKLSQMLPEVTIQPIMPREQKQGMFEQKAGGTISRQQINVISQEISITQVRSNKAMDLSMTDKLKSMLGKNANANPANPDCEIIERRPELIIVNENSNSSQDVMIIEEVPALRGPEAKVPKKRGRPRRNPMAIAKSMQQAMILQHDTPVSRDPLALDDVPKLLPQIAPQIPGQVVGSQVVPPKENERPKRTCSRQKSYAPPRRGRGRGGGRGKRKMLDHADHMELSKKPRIDQDLNMIEQSTTALITIDESASQPDVSHSTSELYKALRQPPMDHKSSSAMVRVEAEQIVNDPLATASREAALMDSRIMSHLDGVIGSVVNTHETLAFGDDRKIGVGICGGDLQAPGLLVPEQISKPELIIVDEKGIDKSVDDSKDIKDAVITQADHQNWLTPSSKKLMDNRNEGNISNVHVIDEETRMSAESCSRSQTPARNIPLQAPETIVNEESQGSVLSTATTESEKVKVKNRRMEINFDPDEGPFTVDKVAEYEWPPDPTRKGETFMIQEQISQYLGVKSFKRKYPDLKRRMVDMEERNYLRENGLVSEAMCDMGLTAVSSSEVLDVMCNDFPDQYEEYRKYIREKQMKEHSKKQKELTAAANAERNRIDLAEMAVQSALSWNVGLNKARRESRKCSLDLQTFTIHVPKKQQKVEEEGRQSHYPVALIPGQYTDYYREYTPAELRYYPLNTVLYGPMKPNERKLDSQSEGSQSDSDSDSSSDDSSSSSSDGTQDTEESQSTMDEVDVELSRQKEDIKSIKCKMCLKHLNKFSRSEVLIQCGTCNGYVHPSCIDLTLDMVPHIQAYAWQCTDCKTCAQCHDPADEDKMLFCDMCDRGYHIYCVGLRRVPQGRWHCQECAVCASCGSREAGGANSDRNSVAQWQHEYKKGDKNTRVYVSTLCVPCSKLWRKGRYCPHCSRCHTVPRLDLEVNLVHCSACDKYLHLGCVETKDLTIDRKNYLCDFCQPIRPQMVKPLVSKVFRS